MKLRPDIRGRQRMMRYDLVVLLAILLFFFFLLVCDWDLFSPCFSTDLERMLILFAQYGNCMFYFSNWS